MRIILFSSTFTAGDKQRHLQEVFTPQEGLFFFFFLTAQESKAVGPQLIKA